MRRFLAPLLVAATVLLPLTGCGTVIYTPPDRPNYIGVVSKLTTITEVNSATDIYPTIFEGSVYGSYPETTGTVWYEKFRTGEDGYYYIKDAWAPADWRFESLQGPCDGKFVRVGRWENHQVRDLTCLWYTSLNRAISFDTNGDPVDTGGADKLMSGESLYPGDVKTSADGRYHLKYQTDGNFVLYDESWSAIWNSETYGTCTGIVAMQGDGNLVVYDCHSTPVWNTGTWGHNGAGLVVQSDGNVVVYAPQDSTPLWSTGTGTSGGGGGGGGGEPTGRWKIGAEGCYWDPNDSGPDQCSP
jgi:hypothetical protein